MRSLTARSLAAVLLFFQAGCTGLKLTHVPPGESVEVALAKKATPLETPSEPVSEIPMESELPDWR